MINEPALKQLLEFMDLQRQELEKKIQRLNQNLSEAIDMVSDLVNVLSKKFEEIYADMRTIADSHNGLVDKVIQNQEDLEALQHKVALQEVEASEPETLDIFILELY